MSYASLTYVPQPISLPINAAQVWRATCLGFQSAAFAALLWGCLALPGFLADEASVTAHQVRIAAPR